MSEPSPPTTDDLVELRDLTFAYPSSEGSRTILQNLSLRIPRGKVTALMGASGGGKTTVLRLIGGQQLATSGQVMFDGQDVGRLNAAGLYAMRRRMGMLFQFGALFTDLNVFDNVAFPLREHTPLTQALIRDIVLMKLDAVGLRGARDLMPSQISGGMARRVALARAIALDPELIMYDEPFAHGRPAHSPAQRHLGHHQHRGLARPGRNLSHCRPSHHLGQWRHCRPGHARGGEALERSFGAPVCQRAQPRTGAVPLPWPLGGR